MKGVILKYKGSASLDELERMEIMVKAGLKTNGFIIVDDRFDVITVETEDENGT